MRAVLKSGDTHLSLSRRTTVGRQGCDITLRASTADRRHAVIEVDEQAPGTCASAVLTDLNTTQGTYINDVRLQNATVRLAHGDVIQFGHGGDVFHFEVESTESGASFASSHLPAITTAAGHGSHQRARASRPAAHSTPITTARVSSAGPMNSSSSGGGGGSTRSLQLGRSRVSPAPMLSMSTAEANLMSTSVLSSMTEREKNEKLLRMGDEISRLSVFENECHRKDIVIAELRQQLTSTGHSEEQHAQLVQNLTASVKQLEEKRETESSRLIAFRDQAEQVPGLRKDLSQRRQAVSSLTDERKKLQQEVADLAKINNQLQKDLAEKTATANMLRSELTSMRTRWTSGQREVEDLRQCLTVQETLVDDRSKALSKLQGEVDTLKEGLTKAAMVHKEVDRVRVELSNERSRLRDKELEARGVTEKLKAFIRNVLDFTETIHEDDDDDDNDDSNADQSSSDGDLSGSERRHGAAVQKLLSVDVALHGLGKVMAGRRTCVEQLKALRAEFEEVSNTNADLTAFLSGLQECIDIGNPKEIENTVLKGTSQQVRDLKAPHNYAKMKGSVCDLMDYMVVTRSELRDLVCSLQSAAATVLSDIEEGADPSAIVSHLTQKLTKLTEETKDLQSHLVHARQEHEQSVALLTVALRKEANADKSAALTECQAQIDDATQAAVAKAITERKMVEDGYAEQTKDLKKALESATCDCREREQAKERVQQELLEMTAARDSLQGKLDGEPDRIGAACNAVHEKCHGTITMQEELSRQHTKTIISMEEKLCRSLEEIKQLRGQLDVAGRKKSEKSIRHSRASVLRRASSRSAAVELLRPVDTSQHVSFAAQPSVHTVSADDSGPVITQKVDDGVSDSLVSCDDMSQDELESEFDNLVRLLEVSRKDTGALQAKVREQNNQIYTLQRDLAGASAQLADLQASRTQESMEIERCLKQELNAKHELIQRQLGEIRTMKEESQRHSTDMEAQVAETQYAHQLLEASHGVESDQRQELKQARMQWKSGVRAHRQELSHLNEKHQKTFSLAEVGARCQAQNHDRVIRDQSAALATLRRGETRSPAATTPGLSSSARMDVDSQQLQDTRGQLALQNKAALATTAELLTTTSSNNSEYELIRNQLEAERHAQHELLATLEESEKVYCGLVRAITHSLDIEPLQGARSIVGLTPPQRQPVMNDRSKIQETLATRISAIREKVKRKEKLLESYEEDLGKLRKLEMDSMTKTAKISSLERDISGKMKEVNMLRESVHRVQDELDQQMRLNTSLRTRQIFKESQSRQHEPTPHSCLMLPSEVDHKLASQRHDLEQQLRRKDLELKTMKNELATTDGHLQAALSQLELSN